MLWTVTVCSEKSSVRGTSVAVFFYIAPTCRSLQPRDIVAQIYRISWCPVRRLLEKPFLGILMSHVQANLRTSGSEFAGNIASLDVGLLAVSCSASCDTATTGGARASKAV